MATVGIFPKRKAGPPPTPPGKKGGLGIIIAAGPPKPGAGKEPPPQEPDDDEPPASGGISVSPEEVDYSENDTCVSCKHMSDDGSCDRYNFPVSETGHCEAGYESKEGGEPGGGPEGVEGTGEM